MTSHKLAKKLLEQPDVPVVINGWGSDEGYPYEVESMEVETQSFFGEHDDEKTPKEHLHYPIPRPSITLLYGSR